MRIPLALAISLVSLAGLVAATDGFTPTYGGADIAEQGIDLGATVLGGILTEGASIGNMVAALIVIVLASLVMKKVIGFIKGIMGVSKVADDT